MRVKNCYKKEFKAEAINMTVNGNLSVSEVASALELNYKTSYNWVKAYMPESIYKPKQVKVKLRH